MFEVQAKYTAIMPMLTGMIYRKMRNKIKKIK